MKSLLGVTRGFIRGISAVLDPEVRKTERAKAKPSAKNGTLGPP
jgi:hypothetical protein